jgi:PD-(D/E)XK nuclease superfamily protein
MVKDLRLSASRIKTLNNCSFLYYGNYILNFPNSSNDGSARGSVVHLLLECLQIPRRKEYVKKLLEDVRSIPSVNRLLVKTAKKEGVNNEENIDLIYKFLWTGLKTDFYYEGGDLQNPEYAFELGDPETDKYKAVGFIDKHAIFHDEKLVKIGDYKSSKSKFTGKELANNVQALMYSLAMHKKYPEYNSSVDFIFLKFPKTPVQTVAFSKTEILGFEEYLKSVYAYLQDFGLEKAKENMAAHSEEHSWLCGRANYPGELKANGTPMWYCPLKFPFTYFAVIDENGNNLRTAYREKDLNAQDNERVVKKKYKGCPAFF